MARTVFTVKRFKAIERLLRDRIGIREIALVLKVSRRIVREVDRGQRPSPDKPTLIACSAWMAQVHWAAVLHDRSRGRPLKEIWYQYAQSLTTYSNFWKQLQRWLSSSDETANAQLTPTSGIPVALRIGHRRSDGGKRNDGAAGVGPKGLKHTLQSRSASERNACHN